MGIPANADPYSMHGLSVAGAVQAQILQIEDRMVEAGTWSCPKEDEQAILLRHSMPVPVAASAATPARVRATLATALHGPTLVAPKVTSVSHPVSLASLIVGSTDQSPAVHSMELERENLRLRAELVRVLSEGSSSRHRLDKDCEGMQKKLKRLEVEVREHWRDRVAELEAEVASLKSALDAANAPAKVGRVCSARAAVPRTPAPCATPATLAATGTSTPSNVGVGLCPSVPRAVLAASLVAASSSRSCEPSESSQGLTEQLPSGCRHVEQQEPGPSGAPPASPPPAASAPTRSWSSSSRLSSPLSSPRAQLPLPTRAPHQTPRPVVVHQVPQSQVFSPSRGSMGAMTSRGDLRTKCGVNPPRTVVRPRSRSVPIAPLDGCEVNNVGSISFFEAFGGFYKQLVQGAKCTGPDALAVDERHVEIDLSAEFPPERREAQFDFLAPAQAPYAFERITCEVPPSCQSVHHL